MANEKKQISPDIQALYDREHKIDELEQNDPLLKDVLEIIDIVKQPENKIGDGYAIDKRGKDMTGFAYVIRYTGAIMISQGAGKMDEGRQVIKHQVQYNQGQLYLGVNFNSVEDEVTDTFEEPTDSDLFPNDVYKRRGRGEIRDMVTVEGPIDSMGPNTLKYMRKLVAHAKVELIY